MKRIRAAARAQGGKCLTASYTKLGDRYRFRCAAGHEWETVGLEVIRGAWCRICSNLKKVQGYRLQDGLARLQRCAEKRGGVCLSTVYEGSKAHYRFRCEAGHEFDMLGARIFRGSWCTECQHEAKRYGMSIMHKLAEAQGGAAFRVSIATRRRDSNGSAREVIVGGSIPERSSAVIGAPRARTTPASSAST